jgi:hypothetical protein
MRLLNATLINKGEKSAFFEAPAKGNATSMEYFARAAPPTNLQSSAQSENEIRLIAAGKNGNLLSARGNITTTKLLQGKVSRSQLRAHKRTPTT